MSKSIFKYQSKEESENLMYKDVKTFLSDNGLSGSWLFNILLVISEAFTNALEHGNKFDESKFIEITLEVNEDMVFADIVDEGNCDIETINSRLPADEMQEGGRGIDLVYHYADNVELKRNERTGGLQLALQFNRFYAQQEIVKKEKV